MQLKKQHCLVFYGDLLGEADFLALFFIIWPVKQGQPALVLQCFNPDKNLSGFLKNRCGTNEVWGQLALQ